MLDSSNEVHVSAPQGPVSGAVGSSAVLLGLQWPATGRRRPLGGSRLVEGPRFPDGLRPQPPRRRGLDQGDDPRSFLLGDPPLAALPAQIVESLQAGSLGAVQSASIGPFSGSSPAPLDHPGPHRHVPRRHPRPRQLADDGPLVVVTLRPCPEPNAQDPPSSTRNSPATRTYAQPKRNPALIPQRCLPWLLARSVVGVVIGGDLVDVRVWASELDAGHGPFVHRFGRSEPRESALA